MYRELNSKAKEAKIVTEVNNKELIDKELDKVSGGAVIKIVSGGTWVAPKTKESTLREKA